MGQGGLWARRPMSQGGQGGTYGRTDVRTYSHTPPGVEVSVPSRGRCPKGVDKLGSSASSTQQENDLIGQYRKSDQ